jgi:NADPH2:quinone reductase
MPIAIQMTELGGPEVLQLREMAPAALKAGEIRVRQSVIGFNYLDVYLRTGVYQVPLPAVLGIEAVGVVTEAAPDVANVAVGDRVAYTYELGAYTTERTLDARRAIALPTGVSDDVAAALLFKGQTAHMLLKRVYPVKAGDTILVHAAAGGVGLVLTQWAKSLGATVIGTVGSEAKVEAARLAGADHVAVLGRDDVTALAREVTSGRGVEAVYDSVARDTYEASMKSLAPFGVMASYGLASGEIAPVAPRELSRFGSPFFIRPAIDHYIDDLDRYHASAAEVLALIEAGVLTASIGRKAPLVEVADIHARAEARTLAGATLLTA